MHAAAPESVFTALRSALDEHQLSCQLWLADYQLTALSAVDQATPATTRSLADGITGRVFTTQRAAITFAESTTEAYLPVDDRGARLGVLYVLAETTLTSGDVDALQVIAGALGQHIAAAGRYTDHFERYRRSRALTLAAELQWALLPPTSHADPRFDVAGLLEPAYSVAGDTFDWSINGDILTIAVCDGTTRGVPAALATTLCATSLRNARRAGLTLSDQAALADQALYAHYSGATYVAAALVEIDLRQWRAVVVDAGSPQLFRVRAAQTTRLTPDAQLPLGMFDETRYDPQPLDLAPGDRLVVISDGVHAATGTTITTEAFGEKLLAQAIISTANVPTGEAASEMIAALHRHTGDLDDDAVVFVFDWTPQDSRH
ncbi:MAG: PP2C family protein-serine/threonine phosphatase [Acidothermaceae bacterium]